MENQSHIETLTEIRSLMERSSRFLSLSGLSGVFAGIFALIGAGAAYMYLKGYVTIPRSLDYLQLQLIPLRFYAFFFLDAGLVLLCSLIAAWYFTNRRARKVGMKMWDSTARRAAINLMIPLVAGGLFCLTLLYHGLIGMVAPATLIFYGMALLNAGKYTFNDIRYLGITEIILGLLSAVYFGYGLLFWAAGFGLMHIIYGMVMYRKYEA